MNVLSHVIVMLQIFCVIASKFTVTRLNYFEDIRFAEQIILLFYPRQVVVVDTLKLVQINFCYFALIFIFGYLFHSFC